MMNRPPLSKPPTSPPSSVSTSSQPATDAVSFIGLRRLDHLGRDRPVQGDPGVDGVVGRSSNFPLALPLMLISIASRHCSSGKVRAMGMLNFPPPAACPISPNVSYRTATPPSYLPPTPT